MDGKSGAQYKAIQKCRQSCACLSQVTKNKKMKPSACGYIHRLKRNFTALMSGETRLFDSSHAFFLMLPFIQADSPQ